MNRDFRRPWDGVDGQDFDHWMDKEMLRGQGASVMDDVLSIHSNADVTAGSGTVPQSPTAADDASQATAATPSQQQGGEDEEEEQKDEFDWEGCDKMHKFQNDRYQAYLVEMRPRDAFKQPWEKDEEEEQEEMEEVSMNILLNNICASEAAPS